MSRKPFLRDISEGCGMDLTAGSNVPLTSMALNENPSGHSPTLLASISNQAADLSRYPDGDCCALKQTISQKFGVVTSQIAVGNGTDDLLDLAARSHLSPNRSALFCRFGFTAYRKVTELAGARCIKIPENGWETDLNKIANSVAADTSVIFLSNPSNPAPGYFTEASFVAFLNQVPSSVLIVLDEAYVEFVEPHRRIASIAIARDRPNLLVLRTFSKAYGLAGLRLGFGVGSEATIRKINAIRQPFSIGTVSQLAGIAALNDDRFIEDTRARNRDGMDQLVGGLGGLGYEVIRSCANFILLQSHQADKIQKFLATRGIAVRSLASYGLPDALRITVGLELQNSALLNHLAEARRLESQ